MANWVTGKQSQSPFSQRKVSYPIMAKLSQYQKYLKTHSSKEVERLCKLGGLERQPASECASPLFIIPKKNQTIRFLSNFWEVNKKLVRKPFSIPKISKVLQELEGFTCTTALDLNMGYYTIGLDPDASKICTIIFLCGKYS
jgi:hypothetical protein